MVGKGKQEEANRLIERMDAVSDGQKPLFTSDLLPHYPQALLNPTANEVMAVGVNIAIG